MSSINVFVVAQTSPWLFADAPLVIGFLNILCLLDVTKITYYKFKIITILSSL
jgi:hypothetical protein